MLATLWLASVYVVAVLQFPERGRERGRESVSSERERRDAKIVRGKERVYFVLFYN